MTLLLAAFLSALLFGLGLAISGMTQPAKVLGFLDIFGQWDPSLLAVMAGAIIVHSVSYRIITRRKSPVLTTQFHIPTRRDIDWRLVLGSAIFGAGWGLAGICPGPALVALAAAQSPIVLFVVSMMGGIFLHHIFNAKVLQKKGK